MTGLLVINGFLESRKFNDIYDMLVSSSDRLGIKLGIMKSTEIPHNTESVKKMNYDFILFWDKDVVLAEIFEICGFRVFNSSAAILNSDNKAYTALKLRRAAVKAPVTITAPQTFEGINYSSRSFVDGAAEIIGYPMVIKELYGSFGQQVYLADSKAQANDIIDKIGCKGFLMQEFIESSRGRDIRINVVGQKAASAMLRRSISGDFRSNISNGGKAEKYAASREQEDAAVKACAALGLDFAGVDILFGKGGEPVICEVNSNPHFKSTFDCTGVNMADKILEYIKSKVEGI